MKVFVACVAVLALVGAASAIECFICNSEIDSACADEFKFDSPALQGAFIQNCTLPLNETEVKDPTEVVSASATEVSEPDGGGVVKQPSDVTANVDESKFFCRKSKIYIETDKETTVRVYRDCGYRLRDGPKCYQKRSEDYVLDVCQCKDDLCNGSNTLTFSLTSLLALIVPFFTRFL